MEQVKIEKRKSYLICHGFDLAAHADLQVEAENLGFKVVFCSALDQLINYVDEIQHCLGIFVLDCKDSAVDTSLIDLSLKNSIAIRFFSDGTHIPESLRAKMGEKPSVYLHKFLQDLVPQKFRDLCIFSVKKVNANLIPDFKTDWRISVSTPALEKQDFVVFCESVFDNFICAVTVRSSLNYVASKSEALKEMSEQDVVEYYSEVCNQILGMINLNLKKININSRIGLPIVIRGDSIAEFKKRSSFFLPVLTLSDDDGGLSVTFQFLVPFMKNVSFSKTLDFDITDISADSKLTIL